MLQYHRSSLLGVPLLLMLACSGPGEGKTQSVGGSMQSATGGALSAGGTSTGGTNTGAGGQLLATGGSSTGGSSTGGSASTNGGSNAAGGGAAKGGSASGGSAGSAGKGGNGSSAGKGGSAGSATGGSVGTAGAGTAGGTTSVPAEKTIRIFWLRPSDVPFAQKYPDGIGKVMVEAQKYYKQELGKTFKLNEPIVETVVGEHVKTWYENTANGGEKYWWSVTNMQSELVRRFGLRNPDSRWMVVGEIMAEGDGAGGGGSPGWVILCQHDADGAVGIGGTMNRWYGGMVHELGHAFGLPDASSDDGTPMSGDFYNYPDTHFSESQKNSVLNGSQKSFLF